MKFGLKESTIRKVKAVFQSYPGVESVLIYGSRAKGNYQIGSDIDLTLKGENLSSKLFSIENGIDDLLLPYKVDLSIYDDITNPDLIDHIDRVGQTFYER
ncbi:MAG: nucleotidyltransferase domain-containing protein [Bacteroidota bacterium]